MFPGVNCGERSGVPAWGPACSRTWLSGLRPRCPSVAPAGALRGGVAVLPVRRGPGAGEPRYLDKAVEVTKATQAGRLPPGPGHVLSQPLLESLLPPAPVEH